MYIRNRLMCGVAVAIIMRKQAEDRLSGTCFRGKSLALAGNFSLWSFAEELFREQEITDSFLTELNEAWFEEDFSTRSVGITHSAFVGWESTDERSRYAPEDLEAFTLNRKASGLRVKLGHTHLRAPRTKELTIVYQFKLEEDAVAAIIHSIYPGRDIGELDGDVTEREQRVFFDWNHPGQT